MLTSHNKQMQFCDYILQGKTAIAFSLLNCWKNEIYINWN